MEKSRRVFFNLSISRIIDRQVSRKADCYIDNRRKHSRPRSRIPSPLLSLRIRPCNLPRENSRARTRRGPPLQRTVSLICIVVAPRESTLSRVILRPLWSPSPPPRSARSRKGRRRTQGGERRVRSRTGFRVHIGRSAARCIRLFPPINPSGFAEGHVTVANDRSVYDDDEENERRRPFRAASRRGEPHERALPTRPIGSY